MAMADKKPILYADDDENDQFLMERAFEKSGIPHPLKLASDGKQAIAYLAGADGYADRTKHPLPCLVMLDLSMPGKTGHEVLQWIRSQPHLAGLPAVVLTSSNQDSDIHRAYLLGASGFMIKPGDPLELLQIVKAIEQHWLSGNPTPNDFVDVTAYRPRPADQSEPKP
jgi:CheY-like chemotaxis protein